MVQLSIIRVVIHDLVFEELKQKREEEGRTADQKEGKGQAGQFAGGQLREGNLRTAKVQNLQVKLDYVKQDSRNGRPITWQKSLLYNTFLDYPRTRTRISLCEKVQRDSGSAEKM